MTLLIQMDLPPGVLGTVLRQFMTQAKLTQADFCKQFGVGKTTLHRLLADDSMTLSNAHKSRAAMKIINQLLAGMAPMRLRKAWAAVMEVERARVTIKNKEALERFAVSRDAPEESTGPVNEEAPMATPALDFTRLVTDRGYRAHNLAVFVRRYPDAMEPELRDAIKDLFETQLLLLQGLISGADLSCGTGLQSPYVRELPAMIPVIGVRERYNKIVHRTLEAFVQRHVVGRTRRAILEDGLELLVVEPDPMRVYALEAWRLRGVVPLSTGISTQSRDVTASPRTEPVTYSIALDAMIESDEACRQEGQRMLSALNVSGLAKIADNPIGG